MELATPDADLVAASRRGERAAFAALIERHLDAVRAVSFSTTRDRALSDDVVQDTFVAAWGQLDRLREVGRLRAWLCGIARNLARQARRRATREQPLEAREPRAAATPFDDLVTAQRRAVVEQAVAELPAAYREVLVLYYQHERSIRDVASALGLSEDAALQRLTRGRRLLATQVVAQIDDALVDRRPRRATVAAILAVLPPGLPSASAAASSLSRPLTVPGASMLKIAALALATAAAAGATYQLTRSPSDPTPAARPAAAKVAAVAVEAPRAAPAPRPRLHPTPAPAAPAAAAAAADCATCGPMVAEEGTVLAPSLVAEVGVYQGPARGPADAPVQIAVYQDLECQFCEKVTTSIDQLFDEYPGQLRLVMKDFPLPHHAQARGAAEASRAADAQGKLWEFRAAALASRDDLTRDALIELARGVGLDVARFTADLDSHAFAAAVDADLAGGRRLAVDGTPTLIINGRMIGGARPVAELRALIDRALAEARP